MSASALDKLKTQSKEWEDQNRKVPEGVYPVFLEHIQFRGSISDFHPMKALIEKYPEDSLMLVWDHEEWYGQNHFLSHDLKVKAAVLADELERCPPAPAAAEGGGGGGEGGAEGGGGGGGAAAE